MKDSTAELGGDVIKAGTNISVAAMSGDPGQLIGSAISEAVGLTVSAFNTLSKKRTDELFDDQAQVQQIVAEIKKSDDFASVVHDVWVRYNLESNSSRRIALKTFLEKAASERKRSYENFTRLLNTAQTITFTELEVLDAFYAPDAYKFSKVGAPGPGNYALNVSNVGELLGRHEQHEIESISGQLNQLGHLGLMHVSYNTLDGPFYKPNDFGRLFLSYIKTG